MFRMSQIVCYTVPECDLPLYLSFTVTFMAVESGDISTGTLETGDDVEFELKLKEANCTEACNI